jgi:hypothetical protein
MMVFWRGKPHPCLVHVATEMVPQKVHHHVKFRGARLAEAPPPALHAPEDALGAQANVVRLIRSSGIRPVPLQPTGQQAVLTRD